MSAFLRSGLLCAAFALISIQPSRGAADETIVLRLGEARILPLLAPPSRLFLDQPDLAVLHSPKPDQVLIDPQALGRTTLHAFGPDGATIATIDLDIEPAADDTPSVETENPIAITLKIDQRLVLPLLAAGSSVFVADPSVARVSMTDPQHVVVRGAAAGETALYALNDAGARVGLYRLTVVTATQPAAAAPTTPARNTADDWVQLVLPEARMIDLPKPATTALVTDPTIAGARIQPPAQLIIFGKSPGETTIHTIDGAGKPVAEIRVSVSPEPPPEP